jgi:hypothetical protein
VNGPDESKATASSWQDFQTQFMEFAREEQRRDTPITAGSAIRRMDQVLRVTCNYKDYSESIATDAEIVHSYKEMRNIDLTPEHLAVVKSKLHESKAAEKKRGLKAPATGRWTWGDGMSENFQERVRSLVAHAGAARGCPKDADPKDFWLHQLWLDLRKNDSDMLFTASEEGGTILSVCVASATFCARLERMAIQKSDPERMETSARVEAAQNSNAREPALRQILTAKGFSVRDWAKNADVDFHTADDFLKGKTTPYASTLKKLADALGMEISDLPT